MFQGDSLLRDLCVSVVNLESRQLAEKKNRDDSPATFWERDDGVDFRFRFLQCAIDKLQRRDVEWGIGHALVGGLAEFMCCKPSLSSGSAVFRVNA